MKFTKACAAALTTTALLATGGVTAAQASVYIPFSAERFPHPHEIEESFSSGSSDSSGDSAESSVLGSSSESSGSSGTTKQDENNEDSVSPDRSDDPDFDGSQLVTFGDSFVANPSAITGRLKEFNLDPQVVGSSSEYTRSVEIGASGCSQDGENWPRILSKIMNRTLADYSCNGATSNYAAVEQIDRAIAHKQIGPDTQEIVILVGGMDYRDRNSESSASIPNSSEITDQYIQNLESAANKVREVAPDAEITLASYPSMVSDDDRLCVFQVIPNAPMGIRVPGLKGVEGNITDMQRRAAEKIDARFVDIREQTRGHDTCAPDGQRYVSGTIDWTSPIYTQSLHPTIQGAHAMAEIIAQR